MKNIFLPLEIFVEMVLPILNTSTKEFAEAKKQSVLVFGFCIGMMIIMYTQTYRYI